MGYPLVDINIIGGTIVLSREKANATATAKANTSLPPFLLEHSRTSDCLISPADASYRLPFSYPITNNLPLYLLQLDLIAYRYFIGLPSDNLGQWGRVGVGAHVAIKASTPKWTALRSHITEGMGLGVLAVDFVIEMKILVVSRASVYQIIYQYLVRLSDQIYWHHG